MKTMTEKMKDGEVYTLVQKESGEIVLWDGGHRNVTQAKTTARETIPKSAGGELGDNIQGVIVRVEAVLPFSRRFTLVEQFDLAKLADAFVATRDPEPAAETPTNEETT